MIVDCLLDTNVLVYAVDVTPCNAAKRAAAMQLIATEDFGLSAQVLQEFYVTVTRKLAKPLGPGEAMAFLDRFRAFPVLVVDAGLVYEGARNAKKFQVSYWDGAIIAAAERLHAKTLYSEDLNHGQRYGSIEALNPFIGIS